jgi:hypothetical protein
VRLSKAVDQHEPILMIWPQMLIPGSDGRGAFSFPRLYFRNLEDATNAVREWESRGEECFAEMIMIPVKPGKFLLRKSGKLPSQTAVNSIRNRFKSATVKSR